MMELHVQHVYMVKALIYLHNIIMYVTMAWHSCTWNASKCILFLCISYLYCNFFTFPSLHFPFPPSLPPSPHISYSPCLKQSIPPSWQINSLIYSPYYSIYVAWLEIPPAWCWSRSPRSRRQLRLFDGRNGSDNNYRNNGENLKAFWWWAFVISIYSFSVVSSEITCWLSSWCNICKMIIKLASTNKWIFFFCIENYWLIFGSLSFS